MAKHLKAITAKAPEPTTLVVHAPKVRLMHYAGPAARRGGRHDKRPSRTTQHRSWRKEQQA